MQDPNYSKPDARTSQFIADSAELKQLEAEYFPLSATPMTPGTAEHAARAEKWDRIVRLRERIRSHCAWF